MIATVDQAGAADAAAQGPATILVMDGSGSMWGQIDGRPKLEIARETVAAVLEGVDPARALGLIAYGHRRKGDCADIELLVPPAPGTAGAIRQAVDGMRFLGKTPLSAAVRQAAEALRYTEDAATVVLVTDGLETCAADPCALGAELEAAGVDFTTHVIGFGLTKEEGAGVACLADATGGRYIEASDAATLATALAETVAATPVPETPPRTHFPGAPMMPDIALEPTGQTFGPDAEAPADLPFPPEGSIARCAASCEGDRLCAAWRYEPKGSYFVEHARCFRFAYDAEMDMRDYDPSEGWASGMKPDAELLVRPYKPAEEAVSSPVPVVIRIGEAHAGLPVGWSAVPLDGQAAEAVAMPEAITGDWQTTLEPGAWQVEGEAPTGARFTGRIEVAATEGGTAQVFDLPQSRGPTLETDGMGEDAAAAVEGPLVCAGKAPCAFTDAATGLAFTLPPGWVATPPYVLETAGGARADQPSLEIARSADAPPVVALNPRQWAADLGPCRDTPAGRLCQLDDDPEAGALARAVARDITLAAPTGGEALR
ncbi:VWA domain-containing protein [Tistrella mobilis]|uniref:vWA domain-containing protein n=1 Tax=Tistrella mobilis TaxID=171437 RepID=UPI003559209C